MAGESRRWLSEVTEAWREYRVAGVVPRFPDASPFVTDLSADVFSHLAEYAKGVPGPVCPLHVGDTYLPPLPAARAEAQGEADAPGLHRYAQVQGEPMLLDAIEATLSRKLGRSVERRALQVMAGATAGLTCVSAAIVQPGDEVILPAPYWPLIRGILRGRGAVPVEVPLFDRLTDPGFDPVAAIEAALTPRTTAVYLNTPNNPTGACLSLPQLQSLGELCEAHDLWVMADQVYEDLFLSGTPPALPHAVPSLQERCIATHSLSKAYGLAGARVGYTHGPSDIMGTIAGVQTFFTYCAARPMQRGAARALNEGDAWLAKARASYRQAAAASAETLGVRTPDAGTFVFFDSRPFLRAGEDANDFLLRCLDAGVMLTPGIASGAAYGSFARLCFTAVPPSELHPALTRLAKVLHQP